MTPAGLNREPDEWPTRTTRSTSATESHSQAISKKRRTLPPSAHEDHSELSNVQQFSHITWNDGVRKVHDAIPQIEGVVHVFEQIYRVDEIPKLSSRA